MAGAPPGLMAALQGGSGGQPQQPPGAAAPAAMIGRMLQGQRMTPQGSGDMEIKILEQCMVNIGKVLQTIMMTKPQAYMELMRAQTSLMKTIQQLKEGVQDAQEHQQMTSSIMNLLRTTGGGPQAAPGGGGPMPMGAGQQLG